MSCACLQAFVRVLVVVAIAESTSYCLCDFSVVTQADRKRQRSSKKAARRKARKEKLADEKLISRLEPGLGLNNPYEKRRMAGELALARSRGKVTTGKQDVNSTKFGKSGTFFKRLQAEAHESIRSHAGDKEFDGRNAKKQSKSSSYKLQSPADFFWVTK